MTVTLTYDATLSRVRIALSAFAADGTVRVERSTDQIRWTTVRGGSAVPIVSGAGSLDDYEFSADVLNHYRVAPVDPPAGLWLPGTSGNYASTPDVAALDITGDIDLRADVTPDTIANGANQYVLSKYHTTGSQRGYGLTFSSVGRIRLVWSSDGVNVLSADSTVAPTLGPDGRIAIRVTLDVDNGAAGRTATFYTAPDISGPWTQLGSTVTQAGVTSIFSNTASMTVGGRNDGAADLYPGTVHAAEVRSGINGTIVANPVFTAQPTGTPSFADGAGRTWTISGTATILTTPIESDTITPALTTVWLKNIAKPFLNTPVTVTDWSPVSRAPRDGVFDIVGRSNPVSVTDVRGPKQWTLQLRTPDTATANNLDFLLASGDPLFIHLPAGCPVPGGYVHVGTTSEDRPTPRSQRRIIELPCTNIAAPGPHVVGATATCLSILNNFATCADVLAAFATCADLADYVASPEDILVP